MASHPAHRRARLEYIRLNGTAVPRPQPLSVWKRARMLHQGRRLILNALQAARPRLEPRHWVSEERLKQAGISRSVLAPFHYNASLALVRIPSRLYWQVKLRTPDWGRRARERARQRATEKLAARKELALLPDLDFMLTLGLGR